MNETVKAALLAERATWLEECRSSERTTARAEQTVQMRRLDLDMQRGKLADIEAFLRDNGVDLAAVDAEAEKARSSQSALSTGIAQNYGQSLIDLGGLYGVNQNAQNARGALNTYNATAGLAKALDEA